MNFSDMYNYGTYLVLVIGIIEGLLICYRSKRFMDSITNWIVFILFLSVIIFLASLASWIAFVIYLVYVILDRIKKLKNRVIIED